MNRNETISSFRKEIFGTIKTDTTETEFFQNNVLRPILKFQNDVWISVFNHYLKKNAKDFNNKKSEQKIVFIQNSFQKDDKFRSLNIGIAVGLMTIDEIEAYYKNKSEYNKRIITMLTERIVSQLQLIGQ